MTDLWYFCESPAYFDQRLVKLELAAAIHDKQKLEYLHQDLVKEFSAANRTCAYWREKYNELYKSYGL